MDLDIILGFCRLVAYIVFIYFGIGYFHLKKVVKDYRLVNVNLNKLLISLLEEKYGVKGFNPLLEAIEKSREKKAKEWSVF